MAVILVRGAGDVGSGVAHALYTAGHIVVLHDSPAPSHTRRGMAFVNAFFEGKAELEGVLAKRAITLADMTKMADCHRAVPVVEAPFESVMAAVRPDVLVDARMRKHEKAESQRGLAPLTIGLGPNFEAGKNTDAAVETAWGNELGAVLWSGRTRDLEGEPQELAGHARDRYVYAPVGGIFNTQLNVGDIVSQGREIARIGEHCVYAPLSGCLRGISHDGVRVREGTKVVEIDPRGLAKAACGIGERPRLIAQGVLKAVRAHLS